MGLFLALSCAASAVDAARRRLPNPLLAAMAATALAFQAARALAPGPWPLVPWTSRLAAALGPPLPLVASAAALTAAAAASELAFRRASGRGAFGMGDVKLLGCWSLMVGWAPALASLAAASLLGALWAAVRGRRTFALGPWVTAVASLAAWGLAWGPVLVFIP